LSRRKATKVLSQAVHLADIDPRDKEREKKILFYRKHGFKTTQEVYDIKGFSFTFLRLQKKYGELEIYELAEVNRYHIRKRQSQIS
jgi:hypothetical protein